jgi:hypothetical protein
MAFRKQIIEMDLKIESLRRAIEALRAGNASPPEVERALAALARTKAERLRLLSRDSNFGGDRIRHPAMETSGPQEPAANAANAARPGDTDGQMQQRPAQLAGRGPETS